MATPNLVNIATITPKNAMGSLADTNRTTMIDVPCLLYTSDAADE